MNKKLDTHEHICLLRLLKKSEILKEYGYTMGKLCPRRRYMKEKCIPNTKKEVDELSFKCDFCDFCRYQATVNYYHDNIKLMMDSDAVIVMKDRKAEIIELYNSPPVDIDFIKQMET